VPGKALRQLNVKTIARTGDKVGIPDAQMAQFTFGLNVLQIGRCRCRSKGSQRQRNQPKK